MGTITRFPIKERPLTNKIANQIKQFAETQVDCNDL